MHSFQDGNPRKSPIARTMAWGEMRAGKILEWMIGDMDDGNICITSPETAIVHPRSSSFPIKIWLRDSGIGSVQ
jgi:hypothetical protein